jgi:aconitate hydratase
MGVLPCQLKESLVLDGSETFDIIGLSDAVKPRQDLTLVIYRANGSEERVPVLLRIDTQIEVEYYRHGGILPFVLRQLASRG